MSIPEEELGGDPACWAHLFEEELMPGEAGTGDASAADFSVADFAELAQAASARGVAWARQSDDLNVNLVVFAKGGGVDAHVNNDVDVLMVVMAGEGILELEGLHRPLRAGQAALIPKGTRRSIRSASERFAYLTCHRRRVGLWPTLNKGPKD